MKARKKPIIVDVWQLGSEPIPLWAQEARTENQGIEPDEFSEKNGCYHIGTWEGLMTAHEGDYLIKGVEGELWAVQKDIFEKTYEILDEGFYVCSSDDEIYINFDKDVGEDYAHILNNHKEESE